MILEEYRKVMRDYGVEVVKVFVKMGIEDELFWFVYIFGEGVI